MEFYSSKLMFEKKMKMCFLLCTNGEWFIELKEKVVWSQMHFGAQEDAAQWQRGGSRESRDP